MLSLLPTDDKDILNNLSRELFRHDYSGDVGYLLTNDGEPIGLARFKVGKTSVLYEIDVREDFKDKGHRDFFTRSILYRLGQISLFIQIDYQDEYFEKFGFIKTEKGKMSIETSKLDFPAECKNKE